MGTAIASMGTLGIIGGGQLARMTALAARSMGYRVRALDPSASCPVAPLVDELVKARFDDVEAARALARNSDVVTLDLEQVDPALLEAAAQIAPVRPSAAAMRVVRDRAEQKRWLAARGFPVGPFEVAEGEAEVRRAAAALGGTVYLKARVGGFDGRGQCRVESAEDALRVLPTLGTERITLELALPVAQELSVLVARRPSGETVAYPPALNHHEDGILAWTLLPGPFAEDIVQRASELSCNIARALQIEGLCTVELFLLADGTLLVNELAPRPHNSYHGSERAFETSQFEQHVRSVFDLPLGSIAPLRPTAMANLLGDSWLRSGAPNFERALQIPGVRAHLYGKEEARPGRKLGHLTATGDDAAEALARVTEAKALLFDAAIAEASDGVPA